MSNDIARTILQQLGGNRFIAMTGAKNLVGHKDGLSFTLPATLTKQRANRMLIRLDPSDTYTLELSKVDMRRLAHTVLDTRSDVYCDNLREVFTDMTGMATSL